MYPRMFMGGPEPLILGKFPGAFVALSLRRLNLSYVGAAIRVRRNSDNAEMDIGFDGSNNFDTATFTTFKGAASCFVVKWYDQSGYANDVVQVTAANQPSFNGSELIANGNASGVAKFLQKTSPNNPWTYTGAGNIYAIARFDDNNSSAGNRVQSLCTQSDNTGSHVVWSAGCWALQSIGLCGDLGSDTVAMHGAIAHAINTYFILNYRWTNFSTYRTNGNSKIRWNDTESTTYTFSSSSNPASLGANFLFVFKSGSNFAPYGFDGRCKEMILYPVDNNNGCSPNMRAYYGI